MSDQDTPETKVIRLDRRPYQAPSPVELKESEPLKAGDIDVVAIGAVENLLEKLRKGELVGLVAMAFDPENWVPVMYHTPAPGEQNRAGYYRMAGSSCTLRDELLMMAECDGDPLQYDDEIDDDGQPA
jgi:hypothetical protein